MNGKLITHHYTECGLPNIWIQYRYVKNDAKLLKISNNRSWCFVCYFGIIC